mgnify:CR=1 FL=1
MEGYIMNCEQARGSIVEFIYDELPPELISELQKHLAVCKDCLEYREQMQRTVDCLNQSKELQASVNPSALHDIIEKKRQAWQFLHRRLPIWGTAIVAVCCIMLSVFALLASEIQYKDNILIIKFNGEINKSETDQNFEKTVRLLENYRKDQLQFQDQLTGELRASIASLSKTIRAYESQRDKQFAGALQQMQIQQYQTLVTIQKELEILASQTENEFKRSYLTMAAMMSLVNPQYNP